jgi:hypothetical protein
MLSVNKIIKGEYTYSPFINPLYIKKTYLLSSSFDVFIPSEFITHT